MELELTYRLTYFNITDLSRRTYILSHFTELP